MAASWPCQLLVTDCVAAPCDGRHAEPPGGQKENTYTHAHTYNMHMQCTHVLTYTYAHTRTRMQRTAVSGAHIPWTQAGRKPGEGRPLPIAFPSLTVGRAGPHGGLALIFLQGGRRKVCSPLSCRAGEGLTRVTGVTRVSGSAPRVPGLVCTCFPDPAGGAAPSVPATGFAETE